MGTFESLLPPDIKSNAHIVVGGDELLFLYPEALAAIESATWNSIAVLGVELTKLPAESQMILSWSTYEIKDSEDWGLYVRENNEQAKAFVEANQAAENCGYVFTSVSREEFDSLTEEKERIKRDLLEEQRSSSLWSSWLLRLYNRFFRAKNQ